MDKHMRGQLELTWNSNLIHGASELDIIFTFVQINICLGITKIWKGIQSILAKIASTPLLEAHANLYLIN